MKILAIGDPHGKLEKLKDISLKDIDLVLLNGDLATSEVTRKYYFKYKIQKKIQNWRSMLTKEQVTSMYQEVIDSAIDVLKHFSKKPTFFVYGNTEWNKAKQIQINKEDHLEIPFFDDEVKKIKNVKNISFKVINFKGIKIAGVPFYTEVDWVKRFSLEKEGYMASAKKSEPDVKKFIKKIPKIDILLTHIPPYGILDRVDNPLAPKSWQGKHAGSKLILDYIKKEHPQYVFCGHIHEAVGQSKLGKTDIFNLGLAGYKIIKI